MTPTDTSEERGTLAGNRSREAREIMAQGERLGAESIANLRDTLSSAKTAIPGSLTGDGDVEVTPVPQESFAGAEGALLQDIDAILSRLDAGIVKQREAMDKLVERIGQPAA